MPDVSPAPPPATELPSGTVTVLMRDIEGSTRLLQTLAIPIQP